MDGQDGKEERPDGAAGNRDRVRGLLLARLDEAGLRRPRGATVEGWEAVRARLVRQLAYMDDENLKTLADLVLDHAGGRRRDESPSEIVIRSLAHALQAPPFEERRIVRSWLASVEGPQAEAGGYLVELFRFLRRTGRPPLAFDMARLREEADENRRGVALIRERIDRGTAQAADRQWLSAYLADRDAARRLIRRDVA